MSVIIERLELTDEQVEYLRAHYPRTAVHQNCGSCLLYEALPKPTLRERAYRVVYGEAPTSCLRWSYWQEGKASAVADMARWLYENAGEERWSLQHARAYTAFCGASVETYDSLVDAYAHVVVGLSDA